jgi:hypothetical protein
MKFPEYVPAPAQEFFAVVINKLTEGVRDLERQLAEHDKEHCSRERVHLSLKLRTDQHELSDRLDLTRRLAALDPDDIRMELAYNTLRKELLRDGEWVRYFAAAYSSVRDYAFYRLRKHKATVLRKRFLEQSRALIKTTKELQQTGIILPIELYDLEVGFTWWQLRHMYPFEPLSLPGLMKHLSRVSDEVLQLKLAFGSGDIDAAVAKQKPNLKTEYLRAFAHQLTNEAGFEIDDYGRIGSITFDDLSDMDLSDKPIVINPGVRRAMAITSEVALGTIEVSDDDVRKALGMPEDSSGNLRRNLPKRRKIRGQNTL